MKKYLFTITLLCVFAIHLSAQAMDSVQTVDIGFDIIKSKSISVVSSFDISNRDLMKTSALSVNEALYGRLLGLTALQNGGFDNTSNTTFFIRGVKTFTNNSILILVDGIERPLSELNTNEIESVEVLKDAAAVALYGFRGINGILQVKTKRGNENKLKINVTYDHGITSAFRLPRFIDSYKFATAVNEANANDGLPAQYNTYELEAIRNNSIPSIYPNVDWAKESLRENGSTDKASVTMDGGSEKVKYFTMLSLVNSNGLLKHTETDGYSSQLKYSRGNIRTNFDINLTDLTRLTLNLAGIFYQTNEPGAIGPNQIMASIYQLPSVAFPIKTESGYWGGNTTWKNRNPIANTSSTGFKRGTGRTLLADAKLNQELNFLLNGLSASLRVGYDNYAAYLEQRTTGFQYQDVQLIFNELGIPVGTNSQVYGDKAGDLKFSVSLDDMWRQSVVQSSLNYKTKRGSNNFETALIYNNQNLTNKGRGNSYQAQNFNSYFHWDNSDFIMNFILTLSGSNMLAYYPQQYGLSSVISGGWIMTNNLIKKNKLLNFAKLRASVGLLSSDNTPYTALPVQGFEGGDPYFFTNSYIQYNATKEGRLPSTNPRLEKAKMLNLGMETRFFSNCFLVAELFYQERYDIMQQGITSQVLGVKPAFVNYGNVGIKGVELALSYSKSFGSLTLNVGGQYTFTKNVINKTMEEPKPYRYLSVEGNSIYQNYGLEAIGFFNTQEEIDNYEVLHTFSTTKPGDIKYKDQNGDKIINEFDIVPLKYNNTVPEVYYSFNLGVEYNGLGFYSLFQGVDNFAKFITTSGVYRPMTNGLNISEHYYDNRWVNGKNNTQALYPALSTLSNSNNERNSSIWLKDISYLKLRNIEVYYDLPQSITKHLFLSKARVYVRGTNLLSFDVIKIMDPENTSSLYPTTKSINFGFLLNL